MLLSTLVIDEGTKHQGDHLLWGMGTVQKDAWVNIQYDDGTTEQFVIEPDAALRDVDLNSREPDHPTAKAIMGLALGDNIGSRLPRKGKIVELKHKFVACLHYVLKHYEERFPTIPGFRAIAVDLERPDGLKEMLETLEARAASIRWAEEQYVNGQWPLGLLAERIGADTIEAAEGLAAQGLMLRVARGDVAERIAAERLIRANSRAGCVLDLLAFWTLWRLQAIDAVQLTCGDITLPQSVLDSLNKRRIKLEEAKERGLRTAHSDHGKIVIQEISADAIDSMLRDTNNAITWVERDARIAPMIVGDDVPEAFRNVLRSNKVSIFDSAILALQSPVLFISDDITTREFNLSCGGRGGVAIHNVFSVAFKARLINLDDYVKWSAYLRDAGHNYIGVMDYVLVRALQLDVETSGKPGPLYTSLISAIGGKIAEPNSHIRVCAESLRRIWLEPGVRSCRELATSLLLDRLVYERFDDYPAILQGLISLLGGYPTLRTHVISWARGHFLTQGMAGT
jgi:hypothetical protein